jgi:hypothetical protein
LVLSLCIYYFYGNVDGFQTSPVDYTNYSGRLTGIRVVILNPGIQTEPPEEMIKRILGSHLTRNDIRMMMERTNGDLIYPYFYINPTGENGSVPFEEDPYNLFVLPEMMVGLASGMNQNDILSKLIYTLNFSRNPKIPPIILSNQNVKILYNNIYANLSSKNLKLVSLILNGTVDYPTVDYSQYKLPVTVLTPKINRDFNQYTGIYTIVVKMSMLDILEKFKSTLSLVCSRNGGAKAQVNNPDGSYAYTIYISQETTGGTTSGTTGGTSPKFITTGFNSPQENSEIKIYQLNFLNTLIVENINRRFRYMAYFKTFTSNLRWILDWQHLIFGQRLYFTGAVDFMFTNSPKIPDSVIQNYFGPILLICKYQMYNMLKEYGDNIDLDKIEEIVIHYPDQSIKVDISTECVNPQSSSILEQVRKLVCI